MLLDLLADQPPDFWHDPFTLTIIGAGVAYLIFRKQTTKKLITYQVISNAPIANFNKTSQIPVEIKIKNKLVTNPRQIVLKLRNQGNVAINIGFLITCCLIFAFIAIFYTSPMFQLFYYKEKLYSQASSYPFLAL
ncbi:MAG: hypothetical protein ACR2H5_08980 [Ktedonobacteraceae bacterium]